MREYDRCDSIRGHALDLSIRFHGTTNQDPGLIVNTAGRFLKFLLGGHESLTENDVVEMEAIIREDESKPTETTYTGDDVTYPPDMEAS
jgi:hypothetical protein